LSNVCDKTQIRFRRIADGIWQTWANRDSIVFSGQVIEIDIDVFYDIFEEQSKCANNLVQNYNDYKWIFYTRCQKLVKEYQFDMWRRIKRTNLDLKYLMYNNVEQQLLAVFIVHLERFIEGNIDNWGGGR